MSDEAGDWVDALKRCQFLDEREIVISRLQDHNAGL